MPPVIQTVPAESQNNVEENPRPTHHCYVFLLKFKGTVHPEIKNIYLPVELFINLNVLV